jgi:DNA-binding transcriptional MerR regulator/quercetin dioxygenase-like cupin family protein
MSTAGLHVAPSVRSVRIGQAAQLVGVSPSAIRRWERQGLLAPLRTGAGYRLYSDADVATLRRIRAMRADQVNAPGIRRLLSSTVPSRVAAAGELDGRLLGERRRALGLSLREAGRRARLSASFISAVERNHATASVTALQRLTHAYDTTVGELLARRAPTARRLRPADRPVVTLDHGVRIEQLALGCRQLEPQLFVLRPGASSEGAYTHEGEEFLYVLDGAVTVSLGDAEQYRLNAGDTLAFPSTIPHRWRNRVDGETRLLWINTPPTF